MKIIFITLLSHISFAQTTTLETISTFGIYTTVGAIASTGNTVIVGDLGTNGGAISGFPPGIVAGSTHNADSVSARAALEVDTAYNYFLNRVCDSAISASLGNNQVLTPKVYCIGTAAHLTDELILDGLGDPNSIFIFQINGALTTSIESSIVLINLATKCNVYWQINGLFTLESKSVFKGTVIANGAINLLDSTLVDGRALTRAGAVTLNTANVDMNCEMNVLPIKLLKFESECLNNNANLSWVTASEINNDFFLIEKSSNTLDWEVIGKVNGSGNSNSIKGYTFTDETPLNNTSFYRLKQTDYNGEFTYTNIISLRNCNLRPCNYNIFPNPANEHINVLLNCNILEFNSLTIYNSLGETVYFSKKYQPTIDLYKVAEGTYFFHLNLKSGNFKETVIIKKQ